jgi:hypothetical protein
MTALGKILAFANLVFSLVVAGLIVVVYVSRTNWHEAFKKSQAQYQVAQSANQVIQKEAQENQAKLDAQVKDLQGQIADLGKRVEAEKKLREDSDRLLEAERKKGTGETASVAALKKDIDRQKEDAKALEAMVNDKDVQIGKLLKSNHDLREERVAAEIMANSYKGRVDRLVAQLEDATKENIRLKRSGGVTDTGAVARDNPPPSNVEGLIKQADPTSGLVVLTIGSDAGLARGHTLDVFRLSPTPQYLGQIRLTDVRPTEAVGRPVLRPKLPIQPGDRVASSVSGKGS